MHALEVTFPILALAALGWLARKYLKFPDNAESVLSHYVIYLAAPASLLIAITGSQLQDLFALRLVIATILCFGVVFVGMLSIHRIIAKRSLGDSAFAALTVTKFNLIIIGFPLILSVVGSSGTPILVISGFVSYLLITPIVLFLHGISENGSRTAPSARIAVKRGINETFSNPLIVASLLGLLLLLLNIDIPKPLHTTLGTLASSVVPVGLIAAGLSIRELRPAKWSVEVWLMSLAKLALVPLVAGVIAWALKLDANSAFTLVLLFSAPTAIIAYALSQELDVYAEQSGEILVLTTLLSAVSIPLTIHICHVLLGV